MTKPVPADEPRRESFSGTGSAVELDVQLGSGTVTIQLGDTDDTVAVTVGPGQGSWWQQGLTGVLSILGAANPEGTETLDAAAEALRATEIAFSPQRSRLTVRAPRSGVGRAVALDVQVQAPSAAAVFVRTATARVEVTGLAQRVDISTGSGEVSVQDVTDGADVRTGSAGVRLGALTGGARARTGSGDIIMDSVAGDVELVSGSGDLRIGIGVGVAAELDLRSGAGTVRSELDVVEDPPTGGGVHVRARTGSGTVLVHGAR